MFGKLLQFLYLKEQPQTPVAEEDRQAEMLFDFDSENEALSSYSQPGMEKFGELMPFYLTFDSLDSSGKGSKDLWSKDDLATSDDNSIVRALEQGLY
jgi:hypothetical protein